MINAYDKIYLEKGRNALGRMIDFAVYDLGYDLTYFFELFLRSDISKRFENGDYSVLVGTSGVELAYMVLDQFNMLQERVTPQYTANRSKEYWTGWALAYYQWETGMRFSEIIRYIPIQDILSMYNPYHEMDIRQFADQMNKLYAIARPDTNLKTLRRNAGLSQKELAVLSGVPVRTIQQYEQRKKNINNAQISTIIALSKALYCNAEDLIEK